MSFFKVACEVLSDGMNKCITFIILEALQLVNFELTTLQPILTDQVSFSNQYLSSIGLILFQYYNKSKLKQEYPKRYPNDAWLLQNSNFSKNT